MTVIGLKMSRKANAVSAVARPHQPPHVGLSLWPWRVEEEIPIGHITNGVHIPTWLAYQMLQLYDRHFPARLDLPDGRARSVAERLHKVDPGELWETHNALKNLLLAFVRRRVSRQCRRRGESDEARRKATERSRSECAHDRFRPPLCHLQTGDADHCAII
jgi:glycogen phosphorylase